MRRILLFILPFLPVVAVAQTYTPESASPQFTWQDFINVVHDDDQADNESWLSQMEEYSYLHDHPMDINTATKEDFEKIPMLTDKQIEDIHSYILKHHGMRSLGELMAIPSLDYMDRCYISLFFYVGQQVFQRKDTVNFKNLVTKSEHEFSSRLNVPLYRREGYATSPADGGYNGSKVYNRVVYRMQSMNHVQAGFFGEKDEGEPFRGHRGYDNYSGYFLVKDVKCLRTAVVGDYKLGFGEGLVMNNIASISKSAVFNTSRGIRANTSMDEYMYLRGAAVTMHAANTDFTAWVSKRKVDATLNSDGDAQTLLTSGTHRTNTELAHRHNTGSFLTGGDVTWSAHGFKLGATGYYQHFTRSLAPGSAQYRAYYPEGKDFGVVGVHYGYGNTLLTFSGETAYSTEKQGLATINKIAWKINHRYKLSAVQRYYQKEYYSFYASALSENSRMQNETGGMLLLEAQPVNHWTLTSYFDLFRNPWPRYRLSHSSTGEEFVLFTEYKINERHSLSARYQMKRKESSDTLLQTNHRVRLRYTYTHSEALRLQSVANLHSVQGQTGFSLSQDVRYKFKPAHCSIASVLSYFHTPDYATRVYIYEPSLSGSFSYPAHYGHGLRSATAGSYCFLGGRVTLEAKFGVTCYFNRTTQSSGMQAIHSRWKSDLSLQAKLKI